MVPKTTGILHTGTMLLITVICALFLKLAVSAEASPGQCQRTPPRVVVPKTSGDNGFHIKISGNPDKYKPGELYTITLQGFNTQFVIPKFIGFMLVVEPKEARDDTSSRPDVGTFTTFENALAKLSEDCPNAVSHLIRLPKSQVEVVWKAPPAGTGCVVFKATVEENRNSWYMDDGRLTREFCQEREIHNDQPSLTEDCNTCDEAEYELTFEGRWSKETHPKDFPTNEWLLHFSDIIGATHTADFRIWEDGGYASEGVKLVAERGSTRKLETELKAQSNKIGTEIKAKGLWYPNLNGKTSAHFRADRQHHLLSLLTMLSPSSDWIVGVSALDLYLKNCSWVAAKVVDLYPWDAGTAEGETYLNHRKPTVPQGAIRRITSSSSPDSPFYDPTGLEMKPLARLTLTRQEVYGRSCDHSFSSEVTTAMHSPAEEERMECQVTEWTEFTPCSVDGGQGTRMRSRHYLNPQKADMSGCSTQLVEKGVCESPCIGNVCCGTTEWGEWSECSVTCGKGLRTRTRKYLNYKARKVCTLDLREKDTCMGMKPECDPTEPQVTSDPLCATTQWSEWSPCPVTCGKGLRVRTRLYLSPSAQSMCSVGLMQKAPCTADKSDCLMNADETKRVCMLPKEVGPCRGYFPRWYFNVDRSLCELFVYGGCRGNSNNFERFSLCSRICDVMFTASVPATLTSVSTTHVGREDLRPPVVDCMMSQWSEWTSCTESCGDGRRERRRMIKVHPENGGKPCPSKLVRRTKCKDNPPCPVDCMLSPWSEWTPCYQTCGEGGTQQRTRTIKQAPRHSGALCGPKIESKYCRLPPCPLYRLL